MITVTLGKTGITVPKNGFGALPIQRVGMDGAIKLLRRAYDGGIRFFDTARAYSDSEEKLGNAFSDIRDNIYIATKTPSTNVQGFWNDLESSLKTLKTDHIDLFQFHNFEFCPKPGDGTGLYEAMLEAKAQGKILHIGITNHRLGVAREAIESGLYETLQYPFSYIATEDEIGLVNMCREHDMGFIAMKGLAGGTITNSAAAFAFMAQFDNVLPIWGIQRDWELEEFLSYFENPPEMTEEVRELIRRDKKELAGSFCRGCGYCMPCTVGISIHDCARMSLMLRRSPSEGWLTEKWQYEMSKIHNCIHCNICMSKCPYGLNTPQLLADNLKDYEEILAGKPF